MTEAEKLVERIAIAIHQRRAIGQWSDEDLARTVLPFVTRVTAPMDEKLVERLREGIANNHPLGVEVILSKEQAADLITHLTAPAAVDVDTTWHDRFLIEQEGRQEADACLKLMAEEHAKITNDLRAQIAALQPRRAEDECPIPSCRHETHEQRQQRIVEIGKDVADLPSAIERCQQWCDSQKLPAQFGDVGPGIYFADVRALIKAVGGLA